MTFRVIPVTPADWRRWRAIRLRALEFDPDAFATSAHAWIAGGDTEERWRRRIGAPGRLFLAVDPPGVDVAMIGLDLRGEPELISMWVAPEVRRQGVGEALVRAVIDEAAGRPVRLRVMTGNDRAREFYARLGFVLVSEQPDGEGTLTMRRAGTPGPSAWPAPAERPRRSGEPPRGRSADQ